jgi:PAS domain S-box-containing protein
MVLNHDMFLGAIDDYAILTLNQDGLIQSHNSATTIITGYQPGELHGLPLSIFYTDEDKSKKRSDHELSLALKMGKLTVEAPKVKKDGTKYWAHSSLYPVYNELHKHVGFTVLLKDVNTKKLAEVEAREQEDRYRLIVEVVKDYSIFMLSPTGDILTWNDGAQKIKGYRSSEIIGKHFALFYTRQDIESGKPELELELAIQNGRHEDEGWRVRKSGSLFWCSVVITPLYNRYNELIGFSEVTRDLSEKKKEEELLKQSEERYRLLVGQVRDYGIFMLDEKGRIISWNEGAQRIKGYTADEILGKYFSIFYMEEDKINDRPEQELKVARQYGKYEEEGWRVRKDGTMFWANVVITAIHNEQGVFLGFAKVTRDLTERREAEVAIKESSKQYKLLADELKETNRDLEEANKELEQFTSIVSHDLQEPVRSIKSFLVLIEKKLSEPNTNIDELKTYIAKSIKASNRMRELILNLLHYAQLSKEDISYETVNVDEMIGEVLQNLKSNIDTTGATISINTEVKSVAGNRIQLMQLVQNLLTNSLKFVNGRTPHIKIGCSKKADHVLFSIADNGIGIAKESETKVFELFRREHTADKYPGMGIGLSICKKIVERHHGQIWPQSEPGKGTTFYFTLNDHNAPY